MDLRDGPEEAAFRATLRTWLEANVPSGLRGFRGWTGPALALGRDWASALHRPDTPGSPGRRSTAVRVGPGATRPSTSRSSRAPKRRSIWV